jgi:hypothetical protein
MIYDVNSPLFAEFVTRHGKKKESAAAVAPGSKGPTAKGSDGKYQGE